MARSDTDAPITRPRKSPADKAQSALEKAQKDHDKAVSKLDKLNEQIGDAENEVGRTARYLAFAQANPDLPAQPADETNDDE